MKVIPKLQQGNTIESDNTKVVRPEIHEPIKAKPRQYSIVDLGGEPSNDTRSAAERNRDYWHPIKGAKARFRASMSNETNPLVGIERTILPSAAGAALVTTPAAVVGGALGNMTVDKLTGGWGNWLEGKSVRNPELVTMAHGGRFDFKKSPLLKKQEEINGKRDMRKKFIKSSRPTYKKRIKKAQQGMRFVSYNPVSNPTIDYTDITNPINPFSEYNFNTTYDKPTALVVPVRDANEPDVVANNPTAEPVINKPVASKVTYTPKSYKGLAAFNKAYDEVEASNPEAKKYRQFLTKMAEQESGFNSAIQNRAGAPAYGYFQFMQDDKKYNNIRQYAGTDIETFRNNPKLQIEAAIKLAKSFEKGFSKEDLELANKNGYSTWGLLGGAWLAGNGGVRKFLRGQGNPSDRHWSKEGKGTDVATRIKAFNFKEGGIVKYQEPAHGIARRDAIKDYRPNIPNRIRKATPAEHIQSMINIYGQSEQPTVTSDAKSPWQHQQAQEAASKGYDDYMQAKKYEEGLHNLNGIFTFTDYATLATGLGSLLSKGASMAGKQVSKQMAKRAIRRESRKHIPSNSDPFLNLGRSFNDFGNPRRSITESLNNFIEYLNDPETIKRLQDIDKELGTRYMEGRQWFLDEAAKGNIKFNPIEMWDGNNRIINGMKYPNYSQTLIGDPFLSNPSYKNITTNIVKQDHPSTIGHEVKHGIENYLEVLNKPNMTMEGFKSQHGSGKRLQALFDKDNIKSFEEWRASIKADPQFRTASDEAITNMYNYLTQESEFSSNLHPLVEANIIKGRPGVPNYRDLADFEDVLNNSYYAPPWAAGRDPMTNVKLIYNHLIKDKHRFLSKLNKYGWGIAALGVGMNLMNY